MQAQTRSTQSMLDLILKPGTAPGGFGESAAPAFIQALSDGSYRELGFKDTELLIGKAETMIKNLGVKAGDRVIIASANSPELAASIIACWRLGTVACPLDFRMTRTEMANVAKSIKASAAVIFKPIISEWDTLSAELKEANIPLCDLTSVKDCFETKRQDKSSDFKSFSEPAFLILTSGTTGIPKGAIHNLASLIINIDELGAMADLRKDLKVLIPVPLSHVLGLEVLVAAMLFGCTCIFSEMTIPGIVACNNKFKPEFLLGVPTIYGALQNMKEGSVDLSNALVLLCGGAPMPPSLAADFERHFNRRLNNGYGSTESKIIAVNLNGPVLSVGRIVPSCQVDIVDSEGHKLPDGQSGEVVIRGDMLMLGYLGQEEATRAAIVDGGYKTGDIGYVEDGYLYISGRAKELIIVAGNKVFPSEVEDALRKNPLVKEIAIIGVAYSKLGQLVKAHIVISDAALSAKLEASDEKAVKETKQELTQTMKAFCQDNLKRELRPMDWQFYPANHVLPRTFSGKIDKKQLS